MKLPITSESRNVRGCGLGKKRLTAETDLAKSIVLGGSLESFFFYLIPIRFIPLNGLLHLRIRVVDICIVGIGELLVRNYSEYPNIHCQNTWSDCDPQRGSSVKVQVSSHVEDTT